MAEYCRCAGRTAFFLLDRANKDHGVVVGGIRTKEGDVLLVEAVVCSPRLVTLSLQVRTKRRRTSRPCRQTGNNL